MKRISLVIFITIWACSAMAQQTLLSEGVGIDLPKQAKPINREQAIAHAEKKFSKNKVIAKIISTRQPDHLFEIDDILISLTSDNQSIKEAQLSKLKDGFDDMYKRDNNKTYTSTLKKVNDNTTLVINYTYKEVETYSFFVFNAHNSRSVAGTLEFPETDESIAKTILDKLLESIKFKD